MTVAETSVEAAGATGAGGNNGAHWAKPNALLGTVLYGIDMENDNQSTSASNGDVNQHANVAGTSQQSAQSDQYSQADILRIEDMPPDQRQAAYAVIKQSRAAIKATKSRSPSTVLQYQKKFKRLMCKRVEDYSGSDLESWLNTLLEYVGNKNSFKGYKAALCLEFERRVQSDLARQDQMQRGDYDALVWQGVVYRLGQNLETLMALQAITRESPYWMDLAKENRRGTNKLEDFKTLNKRKKNWLWLFTMAMRRTKYFDAVRAMLMVGCRPDELQAGLLIERCGPQEFTVKVDGAKVTDTSGQPWRSLTFTEASLPRAWARSLSDKDRLLIKVRSKDALRKSMEDQSKRVLPGLPYVTGYIFRELFASNLREHRGNEEVSAGLGHLSPDSQTYYGLKRKGGGRRNPWKRMPSQIEVARPIRPPNRSGLDRLLGKKPIRKKP